MTWNGYVAKPKPAKKQPKKTLLPPSPKTRRPHLVRKDFDWDDLQKVLRGNSAHGFQRAEHNVVVEPVSGLDMRRRIHALGFTVTQFARRHGLTAAQFYEMTHYPAGMILKRHITLLEHEEVLAGIADILETADMTTEEVRGRLEAMLNRAAARL